MLAGCGAGHTAGSSPAAARQPDGGRPHATAAPTVTATAAPTVTATLPGVGPATTAEVPASARQAVLVTGVSASSPASTVTLYTRAADGWHRGPSWPAHNGSRGWTTHHHENDRKSPVGVFTLHDAGGLLPNPGSKLPYTRSGAFTPPASWPPGYQHDFDYVIAIDYNRVIGTSPSDPTRPLGESKGGNIWLHLDHGRGTSACVTLSKDAMTSLLRILAPAAHPVIVMGDAAALAH